MSTWTRTTSLWAPDVLGDETIVVTPSSGVDEYGDPLPTGQSVRIEKCAVLPCRVNDPERGWLIRDGFEVFVVDPAQMAKARAVTAKDSVAVRGGSYEVDGSPGEYRKRGQVKAIQIFVKKVGT